MRDETNERDALLNHAHPTGSPDARDELPAELLATHDALTQLAEVWSATTPSAERLARFARQLPEQAPATETRPTTLLRERARREADGAERPAPGRGRLLGGLVAAVVIVGLLSATLVLLAPGRTGRREPPMPTPIPSLTARAAEEPSRQPPSASWATVAHAAPLLPAPGDGNIVYQVEGTAVNVSTDSGATWRALKLPTLAQTYARSETISLSVSSADPHLVLLVALLNLGVGNPEHCPAGTTPSQPTTMPGSLVVSGLITCAASFISADSGATWAAAQGLRGAFNTSIMWQSGDLLYGLVDDVEPKVAPSFPLVGVRLMMSRDRGLTWSEQDSMVTPTSRFLCSFVPSPGDDALYAVTFSSPCHAGIEGAQRVVRSLDGGASWRQVSTVEGFAAILLATSPTPGGHGAWLYLLREQRGSSLVTPALTPLVSSDGGASWQAIPQPPQQGASTRLRQTAGVLSDGSLVMAVIVQGRDPTQVPERAVFYAWRPGDSAWRPLTTPLTAYYDSYFLNPTAILITHGGSHAVDTLWVVEALRPYGPTNAVTHAYPIG